MTNRRRRKRNSSRITDVLSAAALIVIAVLLLIFVLSYIKNNSFTDILSFGSKNTDDASVTDMLTSQTSGEADAADADAEAITQTGLVWLNDKLVYILDENETAKYDAANILESGDSRILVSSWLETDGSLYYFGEDGTAVDELSEAAFDYSFDRDYKLVRISFNESYYSNDDANDYPGAVTTKTLWAFTGDEPNSSGLYTVKYKKTTESFSHTLGGDTNPQYTTKYAMAVDDSYIYYIAFVENADNILLKNIANKLFRMKPGADYREIAAENVEGYKIMPQEDGASHIYYYDGSRIRLVSDFEKDETLKVFPDDGDYSVDISSGKAVLKLEGVYPVTMESSSFKAGNFTYALNAEGVITAVASKSTVVYGGYTYTIENGESFGTKKARLVREADGKKEVISAEFEGTAGNLHFDFDTSHIIAEYKDPQGVPGLLSISLDGDVDVLTDTDSKGSSCTLYAIDSGYAIVRMEGNTTSFMKLKLSSAYPLAAGVDPVEEDADNSDETETSSEPASGSTEKPDSVSDTGTVHETTASAPSAAQHETTAAQPSGSGTVNIINDHAVEKLGPGEQ